MKPNLSLDSQIDELHALEACFIKSSEPSCTAEEVFEMIRKKFSKIQCELDKISHTEEIEWGKETVLQAAYRDGQSVLERAFNAHIEVLRRGFVPRP